jgi:hypothetical protein
MAIISIERPLDGQSGSTINEKFERTYYRTYWVYTNSVLDDEYYVRTNLPPDPIDGQSLILYSGYHKDIQARLKNINVDRGPKGSWDATPGNQSKLGNRWQVRCEWGLISPTEASESGNPYDVWPEVTFDGVALQKPFDVDTNGLPVLNSAFDYFDNPPPMTDEQHHIIKITRNEPTVPLWVVVTAALKINQGQWYQFPDSSVKVEPFSVQILYSQFLDKIYFRISYTFTFNPSPTGWRRFILDQGYRGLNSAGKLVELFDTNGMALQAPVMLDGNGKQLAYPVNKDNIVSLEFQEFAQIDFDQTFQFPPNLFG